MDIEYGYRDRLMREKIERLETELSSLCDVENKNKTLQRDVEVLGNFVKYAECELESLRAAIPGKIKEARKEEREICAELCNTQSIRFTNVLNGNAAYGAIECRLAIRSLPEEE